MSEWIENNGEKPDRQVDIKLSCDEPEWPGVPCIRYNQNPNDWDWQTWMSDYRITHFRGTKQ